MPRVYGPFECIQCGETHTKLSFQQKVCAKRECRLARRRALEQVRRDAAPRPLCEMCDRPLPKGFRRYHSKCRKRKERERLRLYYLRKHKHGRS